MIEAKIVADSVGPNGVRVTTFVVTYPRFVHSELMTHRMLSRNASSSRAIPVLKQLKMVLSNPAMPLDFAANKPGMQAGASFGPLKQMLCRGVWKTASLAAVSFGYLMEKLNIHKQYANRLTEPFAHIMVVITATEWANFFALRCHEMAQPEIHALADAMYDLYSKNTPVQLRAEEWHLPFVNDEDKKSLILNPDIIDHGKHTYDELFIKMSVARCARVSYLNHEGKKPTLKQDLELYNRLLGGNPIHASPAEHQAQAVSSFYDVGPGLSGNLRGWVQYRKTLKNENITVFKKD